MNFTEELLHELEKNSSIENAIPMENYMKNNFKFLGIKTESRRTILKNVLLKHYTEVQENYRKLALELYASKFREVHQCAIDLVLRFIKKDFKREDKFFLESLLIQNSWWDSVDTIAKYGIGGYLKVFPDEKFSLIEKFSNSDNMWLNRTAIIFQLGFKKETDFELLKAECLKNSNSNEFFIQKAMGWALRDYGATNPQAVIQFVKENNFKPLTVKEALRKIT